MNRSATVNQELRVKWELFLATADGDQLLAFIDAHPEASMPCSHEYPMLHRIADFRHGEHAYRVTRCVACKEQLTVRLISADCASESLGVPYDLSGSRLRDWVSSELKHPAKGQVDWERFRDPSP